MKLFTEYGRLAMEEVSEKPFQVLAFSVRCVFVAIHSVHCLRFESALLLKTNVVWTSKSKKKKEEK